MSETPTYRVRDWDALFEGPKSRKYHHKSATQMPNKFGLGYKRIIRGKDGPAIYGAWCAMVHVLSRHDCPRRGYVTDTGGIPCRPLTEHDLEMHTDIPASIFAKMFVVCTQRGVDWLEIVSNSATRTPCGPHADPIGVAQCPLDSDIDEDIDKDTDKGAPTSRPDALALIYAAYPKKVGRAAAIKAIKAAIKAGVDPARLHERTKAYAAAVAKWPAEDRAYIPNPATWYNQGRWDDDPAAWVRTANNGTGPKAPINGSDFVELNR